MVLPLTGTVSVENGLDTFVWTGTPLTPLNCTEGATIFIDGVGYFIKSRTDTTHGVLTRTFAETTSTSLPAEIEQLSPEQVQTATLNKRASDIFSQLSALDANGRGLAYNLIGVTGDNDPGPGGAAMDSANPEDVSYIYLDILDANEGGRNVAGMIELFRAGTILVSRSLETNAYLCSRISGDPEYVSGGGDNYFRIPVEYVSHDGSLSTEPIAIEWRLAGVDKDVDATVDTDKSPYDDAVEGFRVLVNDIGGGIAARYTKLSDDTADWSGPARYTGPVGPMPVIEAGTTTTLPTGSDATFTVTPISGGVKLNAGIPRGLQGNPGSPGAPGTGLQVDASGSLAERDAYDGEAENFVYVDDDAGLLYIRQTATPGVWSEGIVFTAGPAGADGSTITTTDGIGDGTDGPYTLDAAPFGLDNVLFVSVSGVQQYDYSVVGDQITFGFSIPVGVPWQVKTTGLLSTDGSVSGPAVSVDGHIALFNGSSGIIIKDSGMSLVAVTGRSTVTSIGASKGMQARLFLPDAMADGFCNNDGIDDAESENYALDAGTGRVVPIVSSMMQIDDGEGVVIGDLTFNGGVAAVFDGVTNQTYADSAVETNSGYDGRGFVGKNFSGAPRKIVKAEIYATSDFGFDSTPSASVITLTLKGKNGGAPNATGTDGTVLGTWSGADVNGAMRSIDSSDIDTEWDYVWVLLEDSLTARMCVAEVRFFEQGTVQNMTIVTQPMPIDIEASAVNLVVIVRPIDSITLNTDLTVEVSRDDGTTFELGSLAQLHGLGADRYCKTTPIDVSEQDAGDGIIVRIKTANEKSLEIRGLYMEVR